MKQTNQCLFKIRAMSFLVSQGNVIQKKVLLVGFSLLFMLVILLVIKSPVLSESLRKKDLGQIEFLENRKNRLKAQLAAIAKLEEEQQLPARLLEELYLMMEEDMWLTALCLHDRKVEIQGIAFSNPAIAKYLRNFEISEFFNIKEENDDRFQLVYLRVMIIENQEVRNFGVSVILEEKPIEEVFSFGLLENYICYTNHLFHQKFLHKKDISAFTQRIQELLINSELHILSFQLTQATQKKLSDKEPIQVLVNRGFEVMKQLRVEQFYDEVPIQIQITGGYRNFLMFADAVSKLDYIVLLRDIEIYSQNGGINPQISCTVVAFLLPSFTNEQHSEFSPRCRDPFQSLPFPLSEPIARQNPLQQFELSQLKVTNILIGGIGDYARIVTPEGKRYTITIGTRIGKHEGEVVSITENVVLVKESIRDKNGNIKEIETSLYLHSEKEEERP